MAKLLYSAIASLDGYIEDGDGRFDWAEPDEEVHTFVNDRERPVGTYLYGGPGLARHAFRAGLIDECHLLVAPIAVGAGKSCFASDARVELELLEERRFRNGTVFLRYRTLT